jgi:hypothetical protein
VAQGCDHQGVDDDRAEGEPGKDQQRVHLDQPASRNGLDSACSGGETVGGVGVSSRHLSRKYTSVTPPIVRPPATSAATMKRVISGVGMVVLPSWVDDQLERVSVIGGFSRRGSDPGHHVGHRGRNGRDQAARRLRAPES